MGMRVKRFVRTKSECSSCPLESNTKVWGEGPVSFSPGKSLFTIVGEAPGADEDRIGRPFVGKSGKILEKMLHEGLDIRREYQYTINIIGCRPPNNNFKHADAKEAIKRCGRGLDEELEHVYSIGFRVMVVLGNNASDAMNLGTGMKNLHGRVKGRDGWTIIPTYHPGSIVRRGGHTNTEVWAQWKDDFQTAISIARGEKNAD